MVCTIMLAVIYQFCAIILFILKPAIARVLMFEADLRGPNAWCALDL